VETGKKASEKILVPVLFGLNGRQEKSFEADAYYKSKGFIVEVEAGRAVKTTSSSRIYFKRAQCTTSSI
jgi:hypothetical protein